MKATNFRVEGRTRFPLDMLRYDLCYPRLQEDIEQLEESLHRNDPERLRVINLRTADCGPTKDRWASFGWAVTKVWS